MAKPKPKAMAKRKAMLGAQLKAQPKKANPFELKGSKGHFDTMGRRVSGKKHNVIKAREEAVNRRKKTLLVEYRQLRKANTFVDRRFGEGDPELTETEKGLGRLQAQRVKVERAKKQRGSKFTLSEAEGGEGGSLTHLGKSLASIEDFTDRPDFDDLDDDMIAELVDQYNFGGGEDGEGGEGGEEGGEGGAAGAKKPKSRKQIMEEIIAKSRMYRAMKAQQKEEDEAALAEMDTQFKELVRSAALAAWVNPKGHNKGVKVKADNPDDAAYDAAARELAFEAKGAAGDRTLTAEELVERERQRLEKLEKERLKRMRGGAGGGSSDEESDDEDDSEDEDGKGRKRRRAEPSGDALGDDYESEGEGEEGDEEGEDEEGGGGERSALDERRMRSAAGNHPLQENFRAAAAALAAKYGVKASNPYVEDEDEEGEEGEDEDEEGGEGEEGESEEEAGASGSEEGEEGGEGESEDGDEEGSSEEEPEPVHPTKAAKAAAREAAAAAAAAAASSKAAAAASKDAGDKGGRAEGGRGGEAALEGPQDLPYTLPLPGSYGEFAGLVAGRPAEDLHAAIARIRAFNAVALATENKRKMQEFFGILVQHFAMIAGERPLPASCLDVVQRAVLEIAPEVPYYAATVARARLARMSDQLTQALTGLGGATARGAAEAAGEMAAAVAGSGPGLVTASGPAGLRDPRGKKGGQGKEAHLAQKEALKKAAAAAALAGAESPWPSPRALLQLKLFAAMFPASDRRHPVLTPAALLIGKYLSQCLVSNAHDAAVGLVLCGMQLHLAAPARRTTPEALGFLRDTLRAFLPAQHAQHAQQADPDAFVRFAPGVLALPAAAADPHAEGKGRQGAKGKGAAAGGGGGGGGKQQAAEAAPLLDLYGTLGMAPNDPRVGTDAFKLGLLRVALCTLRRAARLFAQPPLDPWGGPAAAAAAAAAPPPGSFEPMFAPLRDALAALKAVAGRLPHDLQELRSSVLQQLSDGCSACVASRGPMVQPGRGRPGAPGVVPASAVRQYNPRFEDEYMAGRDYDPDRERSEKRRLQRQLVKEKRGAVRELRRDAVFMAEQRDSERAKLDAERLASEKSFYSELQKQEADLRSGGQGGMNPHLRKKKGKK